MEDLEGRDVDVLNPPTHQHRAQMCGQGIELR
jgi:hypothetical protein